MKRISCLTTLVFPLLATLSSAASLTGTGYIYITDPVSPAWTPPSATSSDAEISRLIWVPSKMAFRFGALSTYGINYWDAANLGFGSFSGGYETKASGDYSFAFGNQAIATGINAIAMGWFAQADADSVALGPETSASAGGVAIGSGSHSSGWNSVALAGGWATSYGVAIGYGAYAPAYSIAIATVDGAYATGQYSTSVGNYSYATGDASTALGQSASAMADLSTALGWNAYTTSQVSVALGSATVSNRIGGTAASPSSPQADDPVLMVSKGPLDPWTTPPTRNALTIYRNGATHFDGIVRVKKAGDIPMTGFQAVPSGVQYP